MSCYITVLDINSNVKKIADSTSEPAWAWTHQHTHAWFNGTRRESAVVQMIRGLAIFCDEYRSRSGLELGNDGFFHEHLLNMIKSLRAMLNLDCGRFDCGTLDKIILAIAKEAGLDTECL